MKAQIWYYIDGDSGREKKTEILEVEKVEMPHDVFEVYLPNDTTPSYYAEGVNILERE